MKKWLLFLLSLVLLLSLVTGCSKTEVIQKEPQTVQFCYQDGITALTVAKLVKENPIVEESITIDYEMQKSPDLLVAKILKEEADIAIVPSNLAAQAFNKNLSYKVVGTSTWGTLYLTSTEEIRSFEELKGKEIYCFGRGLTPDLVLRYVLSENGIDPDKDVKITYLNSASELGPAFISGKTNLAVLSEPLVTTIMMKKDNAKVIFDLNKEWSNITGTDKGYPQSSLIIKSDLIENNIKFIESFIKIYEESRKWAEQNPKKLGEYAEELEIGVMKATIMKGIKWTNIDSFNIKDGKEEYKAYYEVILDFAPDFIGGKMPGEELYFGR